MSVITDAQKKVREFASENASTLLTAGGVVGTVATAVLAGRAGVKATRILDEAALQKNIEANRPESEDWETDHDPPTIQLSKTEKLMLAGPQFIPPVMTGGATIAAIIFANRISAQKAAALAAAYGLLENRFDEYKDKVAEKLTGPKKQQIDDEIAQDRVNAQPVSQQVVIVGGGDVLCYDAISGRYFRSSVERIKRAEAEINQELFDTQMVGLSEFYDKLGLPKTLMSDTMGWSAFDDGIVEFKISTTLTEDQQPCLVIDPSRLPSPNYTRLID